MLTVLNLGLQNPYNQQENWKIHRFTVLTIKNVTITKQKFEIIT